MTGETLKYAAIMLAAGIGVPVLAALNAQLGARIGSPPAAATVLFAVALLAAIVVLALTAGTAALLQVSSQPKYLLAAGLLIAFYVLSITSVAPRFGIGNAVFCVLLGQIAAAAAIDHFGLMGNAIRHISTLRASGIGLMAIGLGLVLQA